MNRETFRRIRRSIPMTQAQLAAELEYDACTISRKERGIQPITKWDEIAIRALKEKR